MLRSFRVENHRSIRNEQELLLTPAYDKERPVVPVAAVFGANASGKSNLVDALRWMQLAVRNSYVRWEADSGVPRVAFRLDASAAGKPSSYVVDLVLEGVQYTYGFTVDEWRVVDEWLYSYPHKVKRVIFERSGDSVEFGSTVPERRSRADLLASFMRNNSLLISAAMQARQEEVAPVYRWFREDFRFVGERSYGRRLISPGLLDLVKKTQEEVPEFIELVRVADLGISDLRVAETFEEPSAVDRDRAARIAAEIEEYEQIGGGETTLGEELSRRRESLARELDFLGKARRRLELLFLHGEERVALSLREQSDGTIAWLNLLMPVLAALRSGATVVTDEIDASLHPRLTARLIELFRNRDVNPRQAQLIFTTHDASLLGTSFGRDILGRDEIWFVEKDQAGVSSLYPLTDFHPRKDENTERRYLGGSYGAVPAVFSDTFVQELLARRAGESNGAA